MTRLLRAVAIMALLFFLFVSLVFAQDTSDGINCQVHGGEYICEVLHLQAYEKGEALRIASNVRAKVDTEIIIGRDSLRVIYTKDKTYEVWGYGLSEGTSQMLASSKSVKDIRLELVVLINGIRLEE